MTYAQLQKLEAGTKMKVVQDLREASYSHCHTGAVGQFVGFDDELVIKDLPDVLVRFRPSDISCPIVIAFWPSELEVAE